MLKEDSCPDGGIGRRAGFKIQFPRGSEGSTPSPGTTLFLFSQCNENYAGIHPQRARVRHARLTGHS